VLPVSMRQCVLLGSDNPQAPSRTDRNLRELRAVCPQRSTAISSRVEQLQGAVRGAPLAIAAIKLRSSSRQDPRGGVLSQDDPGCFGSTGVGSSPSIVRACARHSRAWSDVHPSREPLASLAAPARQRRGRMATSSRGSDAGGRMNTSALLPRPVQNVTSGIDLRTALPSTGSDLVTVHNPLW
jgi:hypothetical protein